MWWCLAAAWAADLDGAREQIALWVRDPVEVERLVGVLDAEATAAEGRLARSGDAEGVRDAIIRNVIANLDEKRRVSEEVAPFPLTPDEIERTVIGYEAWKAEVFVSSGVFPKRYWGYLDGKWTTAEDELRLRKAVSVAVDVVNAWQAEQGEPLRVTDAEVAVTFLAESGALYMLDRRIDDLHPVFDVGLDDVAKGVDDLGPLRDRLDAAMGTDMAGLVAWVETGATSLPVATRVAEHERWLAHKNGDAGPHAYLVRKMTFEEAIAGTALMWLWEKQIAERGMTGKPLHERTLDEQFIIGSLVYNSGKLHSAARWEAIRTFSTGEWLYETSEGNAHRRPRLPVAPPARSLELLRGPSYPEQWTSWLGTYHILQRYGGYAAIQRFTGLFADDGSFAKLPDPPPADAWPAITPPAPAPAAEPVPEPAVEAASRGCGCGSSPGGGAWLGLVGLLWGRRHKATGAARHTGSKGSSSNGPSSIG